MPDRKYEKSNDRNYTLLDAKQRVIDLMANNQPLPEVGIYDEPVRYFKANEQWCSVIFGWLDWLEDVAGWQEAQDELHPGIQAILIFEEGIEIAGEFPDEGGCPNFAPSAGFISYYPQNPYNQPDYVPPDYLVPPFFVNDALEYPEIFGYQATDVFLNGAALNIDPINIATLNFPRFVISVIGPGQVELDLLAVQSGGYMVIKIGSMPNLIDIIQNQVIENNVRVIDLNNDGVSIPQESDVVIAEEINIEAEPDEITEIYCVFVPRLDDSLIPLNFGGGIRAIQLCGFEGDDGETEVVGVEDVRFNTETCTFEKRIAGEWSAIEGGDEWLMCVSDGGGMATKEDIRDGFYEAVNRVALQIVSGTFSGLNLLTDEDGIVTPAPDSGDAELPVDNPATEYDETRAATMGGALRLLRAIELYLDKIDAYYGAVNNAFITIQSTTESFIAQYFPCNAVTLNVAMSNYYAYRVSNSRIIFDTSAAIQLYFYCHGYNAFGFSQWLIDVSGYSNAKIDIVAGLINSLADEFWTSYFAEGALQPSTQYLDAGCVPVATQTLTGMVFASMRRTTPLKSQHRMKIKVKGYAQDVDGDIQDWFWFRTAAAVNTRTNPTFTHGGGTNQPSDNQIVYNAAHEYEYTVDLTTLNNYMDITLNKKAEMNAAGLTYPVPFEITLVDLGEYAV